MKTCARVWVGSFVAFMLSICVAGTWGGLDIRLAVENIPEVWFFPGSVVFAVWGLGAVRLVQTACSS